MHRLLSETDLATEANVVFLVVLMIGTWGCGGVVRAVPPEALDVAGGVVVVLEAARGGQQWVAALNLRDLHTPRPHG